MVNWPDCLRFAAPSSFLKFEINSGDSTKPALCALCTESYEELQFEQETEQWGKAAKRQHHT